MSSPFTSSSAFFEAKYEAAPNGDPWNFAKSEYELQRYDAVIRALDGRRYQNAFEPGCSVGVLTERLASLCNTVSASDFSPTAVAHAQERCRALPNVTIRCEQFTAHASLPDFDLIVLSEIGYYFTSNEWEALLQNMVREMQRGAVLLASHWLGHSEDHVQSGEAVHIALRRPSLQLEWSERSEGFVLERWTRV
jgi:cyclopropane fatty-acyl-phospholipid synthase-like methyltransferase